MNNICRSLILIVALSSCCMSANAQMLYEPTVTQIQSRCFKEFSSFLKQTKCIRQAVFGIPYAEPNPFVEEYMMYMADIEEQVSANSISVAKARLALVRELNSLRAKQTADDQVQQEADQNANQQLIDVVKNYQYPNLEVHSVRPILQAPVNTNCRVVGNQVNCQSY